MDYSAIAEEIQSKANEVSSALKSIKGLQFDSAWQGSAHDKMCGDLETTISSMNEQAGNLGNLSQKLKKINDYKENKELLTSYKSKYNSTFDETLKQEYSSKISSLESELSKLKSDITSGLSYKNVSSQIKVINYDVDKSYKEIVSSLDAEGVLKDAIFYTGNSTVELINGIPAGVYSKKAQQQEIYYNGKRLQQDSLLNMKVGQTIKIKVKMTESCGKVRWLTRTSADGQYGWREYFEAHSDPYLNRYDKSTFLPIDTFNWVITAKKKTREPVILSETTFHTTDYRDEVKSMIRIRINVTD